MTAMVREGPDTPGCSGSRVRVPGAYRALHGHAFDAIDRIARFQADIGLVQHVVGTLTTPQYRLQRLHHGPAHAYKVQTIASRCRPRKWCKDTLGAEIARAAWACVSTSGSGLEACCTGNGLTRHHGAVQVEPDIPSIELV